jgi:Uma2 family endonuclease
MKSPEMNKKYNYQDYILWEERWELIEGVPFSLTTPSTEHQSILGEVFFILRSYLENKPFEVFISPFDIRLSETENYENPRTVIQPDLSIYGNPKQIDDIGGKGAPDLVIEILSPDTALKDRKQKFNLYNEHGVKEYWIIDPFYQIIEVYGRFGFHLDKRGIFGVDDTLKSFLFTDFSLDLSNVFINQ